MQIVRSVLTVETLTSSKHGGGGRPPLPFFENQRKCPNFEKKGPDCVHLWVKFFIRNVVLTVFKIFPCRAFFVRF